MSVNMTPVTPIVKVLKTPDDAGLAAAKIVCELSTKAIAERGRFIIAFSGGSLPKTISPHLLASVPPCELAKWWILFADERCVPLEHTDSNYCVLQQHLLFHAPIEIASEQVFAIDERCITKSASAVALEYETRLARDLGNDWRADMVLLGMGPDGHTASLFPGHSLLKENKLVIAAINDSPKPPAHRITMTLPTINRARQVLFVVCGTSKKIAMRRVLGNETDASSSLPAALVVTEQPVMWCLDQAATPDDFKHQIQSA